MSQKPISADSRNNEPTNEGLESVFQQENDAKRARLSSFGDTTLQDLPMELIECILVKAIALEVKGKKLAKSVWKEKADLVINRLRTVCSQWSSILTTKSFRNELQRTLDAMGTVHMEILQQSPIVLPPETSFFPQLITMKDHIFMLCRPKADIFSYIVCDRNNMAEVKDIVPLPLMFPISVEACNVANCLYMVDWYKRGRILILRHTEEDEHQFTVSPCLNDKRVPHINRHISVTADGNLILSSQTDEHIPVISIYNANGSLQHEMRLSSDMVGIDKIIPKPNGNLVLVLSNQRQTKLTEVDMDGNILRQYQSSLDVYKGVCDADKDGRILIAERLNRMELIDSEFNLVDFTAPQLDEDKPIYRGGMHYDSDRNEIVTVIEDDQSEHGVLTTFRFTEE